MTEQEQEAMSGEESAPTVEPPHIPFDIYCTMWDMVLHRLIEIDETHVPTPRGRVFFVVMAVQNVMVSPPFIEFKVFLYIVFRCRP